MPLVRPVIVLTCDSEGYKRLGGSLRLKSFRPVRPAFERNTARYDSQAFDLAEQGIGLAVCEEPATGHRHQVMTSQAVRFGRWTIPLDEGGGPHIPFLSACFQGHPPQDMTLAPFAFERLWVSAYQAGSGPSAPVIELERGEIEYPGQRQPVHRILVSAPARSWRRLIAVARLIASIIPCDMALSETEAALALAQGTVGQARKARRMGLKGIAQTGDAFRLIAHLGIEQIASNRSCVTPSCGDTVEGVHQMRVGVRRLRSAINLFRPLLKPTMVGKVTQDLKGLAGLLGPVRDGDVFQEIILDPVMALLPGHAGLERLKEDLCAERDVQLEQVLSALEPKRFTLQMLDLLEWSEVGAKESEEGLASFAAQALAKRHGKLMKAGRSFADLDPSQRHQLRIRGKKMRYAAEFLQSLFPSGKTRRYLEALTNLVDVLGHLNDIAVARRVLEERRHKQSDAALHHGIGFVEGWHAGRAALLEEQALKAWADFENQDKFWK